MLSVTVQNDHKVVTVPNGASLSNAFDIAKARLMGLIVPSAINGATVITFQVCDSETGTYRNLFDDSGNEVQVTVAVDRAVGIDAKAGMLAPWQYMKLRLGTSSAPVSATADRVFQLVLKA